MLELRVAFHAVLGGLAYARGHAGSLETLHELEGVPLLGRALDQRVELGSVPHPRAEGGELVVARPRRLAEDRAEGPPLVVGEHGDGDPAVLSPAAVRAVGRSRFVGRAVPDPLPGAAVGLGVQNRRARQVEPRLGQGAVDVLSSARLGSMIESAEHAHGAVVRRAPVEVQVAPTRRRIRRREP